MQYARLHPWELTIPEARELQERLAAEVIEQDRIVPLVRYVCGVDLSGSLADGEVLGAAVVLSYPALELVEVRTARHRPLFPYIPGYLSFRETPVLLNALEQLRTEPHLIFVDGHGRAHPRRFGIACHLGLILNRPTLGCAKSVLVGEQRNPRLARGATAALRDKGEQIGTAVRTRAGRRPVYVSAGHLVSLRAAVKWTLACAPRFRLPEPARLAHKAASGRLEPGLR